MGRGSRWAALGGWLNDAEAPHWVRPRPKASSQRADVLLALALSVLSVLLTGLMQSFGGPLGESTYSGIDYASAALMPLSLLARRRYPLWTLVIATILFLVLSSLSPPVATSWVFQACYFSAIYTAVAWSPTRRRTWIVVGLVIAGFLAMIALPWFLSSPVESELQEKFHGAQGPLDPLLAYGLFSALVNIAYVCGAAAFGRSSWKGALRRTRLAGQARTIESQAKMLTRQAVVEERLRLARDLHDSVGHHFTGVGLQAAGVRRILERSVQDGRIAVDEEHASLVRESLRAVEDSTREGIGELQTVLGVLRAEDEEWEPETTRPEAFRDLPALVARFEDLGLTIRVWVSGEGGTAYGEVEDHPLDNVRQALYLMIQEALNNVLKHSTAREAKLEIVSRSAAEELEVRVTDPGPARLDTDPRLVSSNGVGLRGVEERVVALGGHCSYGPREKHSGWTTSFTIPWPIMSELDGEDSP